MKFVLLNHQNIFLAYSDELCTTSLKTVDYVIKERTFFLWILRDIVDILNLLGSPTRYRILNGVNICHSENYFLGDYFASERIFYFTSKDHSLCHFAKTKTGVARQQNHWSTLLPNKQKCFSSNASFKRVNCKEIPRCFPHIKKLQAKEYIPTGQYSFIIWKTDYSSPYQKESQRHKIKRSDRKLSDQ